VLDGPPREHKPERPRVVVTLGTVVPFVTGLAPLARLLCAARGVDATFVVAHGAARAPELEPLPPNVQAASWIGFDVLLPSCHALVHHGGSGTALAALAAGLPQLVMPCGADHFVNASTLVRAGVAVRCDAADVTAAGLASFLADESLRRRAADLRAEIAAMPTPADVVPRLVALT
ncbi:MAG: glycosyltransferase, partial [Vicinamibacterales bacterium]